VNYSIPVNLDVFLPTLLRIIHLYITIKEKFFTHEENMPSSSQPPSNRGPYDPFEKYRIAEIQKDKSMPDTSEGSEKFQLKSKSAIVAYLILLLKKFLDLFEETTDHGLAVSAESEVSEHLAQLKAAIEILKMEDHGQDSAFLNNLSLLWDQVLEDVVRFRRQTPLSIKMRAFLKELQHYPDDPVHSLGYYLTEYAGQKWLPFPYMEMISRLTLAHQKKPESSLLSRWSGMLDEMIQILNRAKGN